MKRYCTWAGIAIVVAAVGLLSLRVGAADERDATTAAASSTKAPEGFVSLFNGKDLSGWKIPQGDNGHWKVVDGVIDYDAQSEARGSKDLWSEKSYGNFVLRVDWRI